MPKAIKGLPAADQLVEALVDSRKTQIPYLLGRNPGAVIFLGTAAECQAELREKGLTRKWTSDLTSVMLRKGTEEM